MGVNRSYLKYLGVLSVLLLGGCSWVADLEWRDSREVQPHASVSEGDTAQNIESASNSVIATPSLDDTPPIDPNSELASDTNHGERLSTLDDGLPSGRLPPAIVPATDNVQRLSQIESGRRDPFASLPVQRFLVQQRPVDSRAIDGPPTASGNSIAPPTSPISAPTGQPSSSEQPTVVPPSPQTVVPIPLANQRPTPPLAQTPLTAVPTIPVAATPIPNSEVMGTDEPVSVARATTGPSFEFSGVVQVGDRINIIVTEPSGSRYVHIGERVGNGQFVIKAVDFNQGSTPAVILERGGAESVHWVGNPIAM